MLEISHNIKHVESALINELRMMLYASRMVQYASRMHPLVSGWLNGQCDGLEFRCGLQNDGSSPLGGLL